MTAAFFDVDGTLIRGDAFSRYLHALGGLPAPRRFSRLAAAFARAPYWWALEKLDRSRFDHVFYAVYRGLRADELRRAVETGFDAYFSPRVIGRALERVERHRRRGDRIVLASGSPGILLEPLARRLDAELLCPSLEQEDGVLTGRLGNGSFSGQGKRQAAIAYAAGSGLDLSTCYGYGDSLWDVPLLESVGHPVAVRPDAGLL